MSSPEFAVVCVLANMLRVPPCLYAPKYFAEAMVTRRGMAVSRDPSPIFRGRCPFTHGSPYRIVEHVSVRNSAPARQHSPRCAHSGLNARTRNHADLYSRLRFSPVPISHGDRSHEIRARTIASI